MQRVDDSLQLTFTASIHAYEIEIYHPAPNTQIYMLILTGVNFDCHVKNLKYEGH